MWTLSCSIKIFDTTCPTGRLLFHMLGAIGEFERDLINERTTEGIARAKANGVKFGPKCKLSADGQVLALQEEASQQGAQQEVILLANMKSAVPPCTESSRSKIRIKATKVSEVTLFTCHVTCHFGADYPSQ